MQFKLLNVLGNKFSYCCLHFSYHRRDDALLKRRAKNEIMDVKRSSNNQLFLFVCWFHNVYGAKVFLKPLKKTALFACYFIHSTQPCSDYVKKEAFARITQKKSQMNQSYKRRHTRYRGWNFQCSPRANTNLTNRWFHASFWHRNFHRLCGFFSLVLCALNINLRWEFCS